MPMPSTWFLGMFIDLTNVITLLNELKVKLERRFESDCWENQCGGRVNYGLRLE